VLLLLLLLPDEIICHPYFLSPGRHVVEDIPQIIQEAITSLQIEIPVITIDPLGSNTQLMLGAIHSLV
jgi:sirohydrochlorin ferrochelatase